MDGLDRNSQPASPAAFSASRVVTIIGFGCFWPLLRRSFFSQAFQNAPDTQLCYALFLVALAASAIALFCMRKLVTRTFHEARLAAGISAFVVFSIAAIPSITTLMDSAIWPSAIAACFLGLFFPVLASMWGAELLALAGRHRGGAIIVTIASFIFGFVITSAFVLLSPGLSAIASSMLPAISSLLWALGREKTSLPGSSVTKLKSAPLWRICILGAFLVLTSLVRGLYYGGSVVYEPTSDILFPNVATIVMAGALATIPLLSKNIDNLFKYGVIVAAIPLLLGLLLGVYGAPEYVSLVFFITGKSCFELLLWLVLVDGCRSLRISSVTLFVPLFLTFEMLAQLGSYVAIPSVVHSLGIDPAEVIPAVALVTTLLFVSGCFLYLIHGVPSAGTPAFDRLGESRSPEAPMLSAELASSALASMPGAATLTPREFEIATLLARGNTYKSISSMLGVSVGTIQTHAKSIYRKLGIHTKQELVEALGSLR